MNQPPGPAKPEPIIEEIILRWGLWTAGLFALAAILLWLEWLFVAFGLLTDLGFGWISVAGTAPPGSENFVWPVFAAALLGVVALVLSSISRFIVVRIQNQVAATANPAKPQAQWNVRKLCIVTAAVATVFAGVDLAQNLAGMRGASLFEHPRSQPRNHPALVSKRNGQQIGIALHRFHEDIRALPAGATLTQGGEPGHSWNTMMLPFLDQARLYQQIDQQRPWDDPVNLPAMRHSIPGLLNPGFAKDFRYRHTFSESRVTEQPGLTHYAGNHYVFGLNRRVRFRDLTDGSSNTVFSGEVPSNFVPWGKPGNWRDLRLGVNKSPVGFGRPLRQGAFFLLGDGSTRFLNDDIDPEVLRMLADPQDGATLPKSW